MAPTLIARSRNLIRTPRSKKLAAWAAAAVVAFGALGFFAAPPLVKSILEDKASEALHRKVTVERIRINPYALSVELAGLSVKGESGQEVAGFDSLYANLEASSLFRGGPVVREFRLDGPRLAVARVGEGRYDISDLIDAWSKPSDSPTPRFAVSNIQIAGGRLTLVDQPTGLTHTVSDLALRLPFVSSLPYQAEIEVEPHFSAQVNGSPLVLEGRSKPFAASHESELSLDLDRVDLARYLPYSPVKLPFVVEGGSLDTELKVVFRQDKDKPATLKLVGAAHLSDLALKEAGGQPLLAWKRLDVDVHEADLLRRRVAIAKVQLAGLAGHVRATPQGSLNWQDVADRLAGPADPAGAAKDTAPGLAWSVGEILVEGGAVHWRDETRGKPFVAAVHDLKVHARHLESGFARPVDLDAAWSVDAAPQVRLKRGEIKGAKIDLGKRHAEAAEVLISGPQLGVVRDRQKNLDLPQPPLLKATAPAAGSASAPWTLAVHRLALADGVVRYEEQGLPDKSAQVIDGINLGIEGLSTVPGKKATLSLAARVNQKGGLKVGGEVQARPLALALDLDVSGFPLLPVQPYFAERLNVTLVRGQVSTKGKLVLSQDKDSLAGGFKGDVTLGDLHSIENVTSTDFLKWKSLFIGAIDAKLQPLALTVGEIALSDFYARMIVTPEGRLNLAQIVKKPEAPTTALVPTEAAPRAAPAPAPAAPAKAKEVTPVRIGKVTLQGGTVNFSDFFVKPNYTVNVTKIGGKINGLSSAADTLADLELRGSYGNAAPVEVTAKLNPLAAKTYLDLKGEIRGIDLTTLSTYAGKYAGYAIDKGKLSLYVTYKLDHNQLNAENRVFLDQLTFGDKVDSPDATGLPVKLAVALLKNGRGEIDINLPISGSLDDPEFSVGGIIVRVIVNLFVKAVTSPFALLGSLFGGGEELSSVEFEVGRAGLTAAAVKKLEALAKAMVDRPALKLEITGRADPEIEREGIKRAAIDRAVKAEKLKEQTKKGVEGGSVEAVEVDAKDYPVYLQRAYKEAKFPKPRNLIGLQKDLPVEEMEKLLLANLPASDEDVRQLAERRAEVVQAWLVEQGKVAMERVFLMPPRTSEEAKGDGKASRSRADFSLR